MTTFSSGIGRNLALNTQGTLIDNLDGTQHQHTGYRPEYTYLDVGALFVSDETVTVTVSFDLVMIVNSSPAYLQVYNGNLFGPMQIAIGRNALRGETHAVGETIEKRVAVTTTWRPVDTPSKPGNIIEFYSTYGSGNCYSISNLMVELGDTAHPYRPAPEDLATPSDVVYASDSADVGDVSGMVESDGVIAAINVSGETARISGSRIEVTGDAVFSAINDDTGTTKISGGKIDADTLHVKAANIDGSLTIGQVSNLQSALNGKASTTDVANAAKRTYVSIRATAIDYAADTATLEATLYIDGAATTTGVTYAWLVDGTAISGATARTYSVPASSGLDHAYSCKATW